MKVIIESYGVSIMSALTILAIITLLSIIPDGEGNVGIFQIIASGSDFNNDLYENMSDTLATLEVYSRTDAPVLSRNTNYHFEISKEFILSDGFNIKMANDSNNYKLSDSLNNPELNFSFDVLSITDNNGDDCLGLYNTYNGSIIFSNQGKYEVIIRCYDKANGKETTNAFMIAVD